MDQQQRKQVGFSIWYFLLALLGIWLIQIFFVQPFLLNRSEVPYSQFRQDLAAGRIDTVSFSGDRIVYTVKPEAAGVALDQHPQHRQPLPHRRLSLRWAWSHAPRPAHLH